jgi:signal transduction histidine kinase
MMSERVRASTLPSVTTATRTPRPLIPWLVDATIALGLSALSLLALASGSADVGQSDPLSLVLLLLETLPLIVRRRWPIPVLVVTLAATALHAALVQGPVVNESLGALVALFTVAERYDRRVAIGAGLAVGATFAAAIVAKAGSQVAVAGAIQTMLSVGIVVALGDWARTRRHYAAAIEENARLQESQREERSRRAVEDERERIARELHDIVTHHVSVIVIQAGAGLTALDRRPERARTALEAIDRTSREALTDMRRMLGILGEAPGAAATGDEVRAPMPRLERLGELVEEVRAAGLPVELSLDGVRRPLDAGVELSAYRIVQEALTNALKHARGARAKVRLAYEPRAIEIEVTDQGGVGRRDLGEAGSGGRGLIGMRERVALYGGEFEAGPTPTGFRVHARLPVDAEPTVSA